MRQNLYALCVLSFSFASVDGAQSPASSSRSETEYTQAQVKQLVRDAHTPEQYSDLAAFYFRQQAIYLQKAAEEKHDWVQRSQNTASIAEKYPRPVDSARNLYEYYAYEASKAGQLAAKFSRLSAPESRSNAK